MKDLKSPITFEAKLLKFPLIIVSVIKIILYYEQLNICYAQSISLIMIYVRINEINIHITIGYSTSSLALLYVSYC